jgi:hypothetical protein
MAEAYDSRQVVGMDLHRCRSVLVRMTEDGQASTSATRQPRPGGGVHPGARGPLTGLDRLDRSGGAEL